jgi:hypothetical protein
VNSRRMKKLILIFLMTVSPLLHAREVTVYLNVIPLMSNMMYLFTESVDPGNGIGQSSDWGVQVAYHLNGDYALSAGYYQGGTIASIVSRNPVYTLSFKSAFPGNRLNSGYFFRLGLLYQNGMQVYSSNSDTPLFTDYMPITSIGYEKDITANFSMSGEAGPGFLSILLGYRF